MTRVEKIHKEIRNANDLSLLIFGLLSSERLFPNYIFFSQEYDFGDIAVLKKGIEFINDIIVLKRIIDRNKITTLISQIDGVTPLPEDFDTILSSSALDACSAIMETLSFSLDGDSQRIIDVSTFCTDTVNMYIQHRDDLDYNDNLFWTKINSDPLMIKELTIQEKILQTLKNEKNINISTVEKLRVMQLNEGKSNINLL